MTKETLEKILEKNKRNHIDGIQCVTIEEEDSEMFEDLVNICINSGYKIISSSCNSSNWKAILVEEEVDEKKENKKFFIMHESVNQFVNHIIFDERTYEFYKVIGFDEDLKIYIIRDLNSQNGLYYDLPEDKFDNWFTDTDRVSEIMRTIEEKEFQINERYSFIQRMFEEIPEKTLRSYCQVVTQLDHIKNMKFYKNAANIQKIKSSEDAAMQIRLKEVQRPLLKAIRRKEKYMHRFISNEEIEHLKMIIIEEQNGSNLYLLKENSYLQEIGFYVIKEKCEKTLEMINKAKKTLNEIKISKEKKNQKGLPDFLKN